MTKPARPGAETAPTQNDAETAPARNGAGRVPPALDALPLPGFLDRLGDIAWCLNGEAQCVWAGTRWQHATGLSEAASLGLGWLDAVQEEDRPPLLSALVTAGRPDAAAVDLRLHHGLDGEHRWQRTRVVRVQEDGARDTLFVCLATDVDDLRRPQEAQVRAIAALQHRMRGTFGTIRAIIRRTAQFSRSAEGLADSLEGRVAALARAQASVIRAPTAGVDLAGLVADELTACAAHEGVSVSVEGPPLRLAPRTAETLALAFHELANNAVQHGALGTRRGQVRVSWSVTDGQVLDFEWRETGLPQPLSEAGQGGYGRELLEVALVYELKAETRLRLDPDGLRLHIRMPLAGNVLGAVDAAAPSGTGASP